MFARACTRSLSLSAALAFLALGAPHNSAQAQSNSLFPKGGPNRKMPQATPLPPNATSNALAAGRKKPSPPPRPDTVSLPYNLVWFDSQNRLASLFAGVSAKIAEKKTDGPNEIWTVNELIAPNLRTSFFTFQQQMLIGLEFDYGQDNWDTDKYNEVMGQFRRLLETKCESPGEIISRKTEQPADSTIKQTLTGYQWVRGDTIVQLFYYAAEDTSKSLTFRSISVHYHYRDPYGPLPGAEGQAAAAGGPQVSTGASGASPPAQDNSPGGALPMPDAGDVAAANNPPPSPTPAASASPAPSATPDASPMESPNQSASPTPDASASPAESASPSPSATPSPSPTATPKRKKKKTS